MLFFTKTPFFLKKLFPSIIWEGNNNKIFLSFDDGPQEEITEWVLDFLALHNIKAHFFCIGKHVAAHPLIFERIIKEGHIASNHSYSHPNGWKTPSKEYIANVELGAERYNNNYFRPPYGKLTWRQYQTLKTKYKIVLWDILSWDFHSQVTAEASWDNVRKNIRPGSLIVYHDKTICAEKLKHNLPLLVAYCKSKGWEFGTF